MKQQKRETPVVQNRGAGPGGRSQANPKADRPGHRDARGMKAKEDKVGVHLLIGYYVGTCH